MDTTTYKPTSNPVATYGEKSSSTLALQQQLNKQNTGKTGWVPLKEDSLYGPKTLQATKFGTPAIVSTAPIHKEAAENSKILTDTLRIYNPNYVDPNAKTVATPTNKVVNETTTTTTPTTDPFMGALDQMARQSSDANKMLIANIQANRQRQQNDLTGKYDSYKKGLQLLGVQHNEAQSTPELLIGRVQEAENDFQQKISDLNFEEARALTEAETARSEKDFKLLKERMDYVKELKKEKLNALTDLHNSMKAEEGIGEIQARQIYDVYQTLSKDAQEQFIIAAAQKLGVSPGSIVNGLVSEKQKREDDELDRQNKLSIISDRNSGGGDVDVNTKDASESIKVKFDSRKGSDGFIDPNDWVAARDMWIQYDLPENKFLTLFKRYLNPDSYKIAGLKEEEGTGLHS